MGFDCITASVTRPRLTGQGGAGEDAHAEPRGRARSPGPARYKWDLAVNAGGIYQDFNSEIISKAYEALVSSCRIMAWQGLPLQPSMLALWPLSRSGGTLTSQHNEAKPHAAFVPSLHPHSSPLLRRAARVPATTLFITGRWEMNCPGHHGPSY